MSHDWLQIDETLSLPLSELSFRFARSSGPGGQHVQRTETKVELLFDLANSPSLSDAQRQQVMSRLGNRVDSEGILHLTAQGSRSQSQNRQEVTERFRHLLAAALKPRKRRRPTKPSTSARRRRLEAKRHRGQVKQLRNRPVRDE